MDNRSQLVPLGNPLLNTIRCPEQVSRESLENMIFLGIKDESGIVWKLVKGNDLSPTKRRLYKRGREHKWRGLVLLGREREREESRESTNMEGRREEGEER